jgi:hypothetical protein
MKEGMTMPKLGAAVKNNLLASLLLSPTLGLGQTSVVTYHYDNFRTGQNLQEIFLTPANVNSNQFRRLFSQPVDGQVYAQPLYLPNLSIPGQGLHNVVFTATQNDSVYAFDADDNQGANASSFWHANLLDAAHGATQGATTVPKADAGWCDDITPQIGITSTPVIDPSSGTIFVVAKSKEISSGVSHYVQRLHALDVTSGAEKAGSPVVIGDTTIGGADGGFTNNTAISVPGKGDGSDGTTLRFNALRQNQRAALLLQNGILYIASGSHCDGTPFHGWVIAYDAKALAVAAQFSATPNGSDGGVWMEGAGLAADDANNLFFATGNGTFDTTLDAKRFPGLQDFGDSILKLDAHLNVLDYFTPFNQDSLNNGDVDLGSGGVLLLPDQPGSHPHLLAEAGKQGTVYLLDRDQMTTGNQHFCSGCTSDQNTILQSIPNGVNCTPVPVYWNGVVYFRGDCDSLRAFSISNGQLSRPPLATTDNYSGKMTISANGNSNGIVWSLNISVPSGGPEILNAYDAVNLSLLYSSNFNSTRDNPGGAIVWPSPVTADGKVYLGAVDRLSVFGLYGIGGYDLESSADESFPFDYDSSGKSNYLALYRPGTGMFWILKNNAGNFTPVYQQADPGNGIGGYDLKSTADRAFAFDYDSSGKPDHIVLYRPGAGTIWILKNSAGKFSPVYQGTGIGGYDLQSPADQVFAFDYDGSGKPDHLVLYRPGAGTIWILKNSAGTFSPVYQNNGIGGYNLQSAADQVFAFDYDGSGKPDHLVLYRPGTGTIWILQNSAGTFSPVYQGTGIGGYDLQSPSDRALAMDYDRSGRLDHLALYRPGVGTIWILKNSAGAFAPVYQGGGIGGYNLNSAVDHAMTLDYDGSGKFDHLVLYRPGTSKIAIVQSSAGTFAPIYAAWEHTP